MSIEWVRQLCHARLTIALAVTWLVIEAVRVSAFSQSASQPDELQLKLGLMRATMHSLMFWQVLTYSFIHGGWTHVLMNVLLMLCVGSRLEWILGRRALAIVLTSGVLLGAALHLALSSSLLVGASAAVFAALLCITTLSSESRWLVPFPLSAKNLGRGLMLSFLLFILIDPAFGIPGCSRLGEVLVDAGWGDLFRISHVCHFGGALAGWLCARWILRNRVSLEKLQRQRAARELDLGPF